MLVSEALVQKESRPKSSHIVRCGRVTNDSRCSWGFLFGGRKMPRHKTKTSYKSGEQHICWKGGGSAYWRREACKIMNCPKGLIVHHIDGDWSNNDRANLQVITQSEHVAIHNKQRKGEIKSNCKMRKVIKDVLELRCKGVSRKKIADILNISFRMVKRCLSTEGRIQYG